MRTCSTFKSCENKICRYCHIIMLKYVHNIDILQCAFQYFHVIIIIFFLRYFDIIHLISYTYVILNLQKPNVHHIVYNILIMFKSIIKIKVYKQVKIAIHILLLLMVPLKKN